MIVNQSQITNRRILALSATTKVTKGLTNFAQQLAHESRQNPPSQVAKARVSISAILNRMARKKAMNSEAT